MKRNFSMVRGGFLVTALAMVFTPVAPSQPWVSFDSHSRYVALGDSISAGYGAMPATQGFPYQLYQSGAIDSLPNTLFCMMAVPGALTQDVLDHQVPQVNRFLSDTGTPYRQVITLITGGNDMLQMSESVRRLDRHRYEPVPYSELTPHERSTCGDLCRQFL